MTRIARPRILPALAAAALIAACTQPPISTNPDDVRNCQLQALESVQPGILPDSPTEMPVRRQEFVTACLQEAAQLRARGGVPQ